MLLLLLEGDCVKSFKHSVSLSESEKPCYTPANNIPDIREERKRVHTLYRTRTSAKTVAPHQYRALVQCALCCSVHITRHSGPYIHRQGELPEKLLTKTVVVENLSVKVCSQLQKADITL